MNPMIDALVGFCVAVVIVSGGLCVYYLWRTTSPAWTDAAVHALPKQMRMVRRCGLGVIVTSGLVVLWALGRLVLGV